MRARRAMACRFFLSAKARRASGARCGGMEWSRAAGVRVGGSADRALVRPLADTPAGGATSPSEPGGGHVIQGSICARRRYCSEHRRYRIGCEQETKGPARQRPAGSGHRSAQRRALQPIQSLTHRRWQPRLQSKPHDLEVKPAFQIPERAARPRTFHGAKHVAFTRARSSPPARPD